MQNLQNAPKDMKEKLNRRAMIAATLDAFSVGKPSFSEVTNLDFRILTSLPSGGCNSNGHWIGYEVDCINYTCDFFGFECGFVVKFNWKRTINQVESNQVESGDFFGLTLVIIPEKQKRYLKIFCPLYVEECFILTAKIIVVGSIVTELDLMNVIVYIGRVEIVAFDPNFEKLIRLYSKIGDHLVTVPALKFNEIETFNGYVEMVLEHGHSLWVVFGNLFQEVFLKLGDTKMVDTKFYFIDEPFLDQSIAYLAMTNKTNSDAVKSIVLASCWLGRAGEIREI